VLAKSVTVEIVGSNPTGDALIARYANWQSGERPPLGRWCPTFAHVGSTPTRATDTGSASG